MKIAVAKEIKRHEYRVGATPSCVQSYISSGHSVQVETGAGVGAGFSDAEYQAGGAVIVSDRKKMFDWAEMIVKVKEPQASEYELFHPGQILFTYLHLAADKPQTEMLVNRKISGVAYETIQLADGALPCLCPMSEIAGRLAIQEGAKYLEKPLGGKGVLLGGVPGVPRGKVTILGGGVVGKNAAQMALGIGAKVTVLDLSHERLRYMDDIFGGQITALYSNRKNLLDCLRETDLLVGAVLVTGATAPRLVNREDLKVMKAGSVIVDVAVDQGGCIETTRPTTHDDPIFVVDGIIHYCVANMPGAVPITSTIALVDQTLRYGLSIANKGLVRAAGENLALKLGINTYNGYITHPAVAKSLGIEYREFKA
ncbi:MAG: alanine dehydrogenase [Phycisphaerae bacterium]